MSPSEGQVHQATHKGQRSLSLSVASVLLEPGPTDGQARPPAQAPPSDSPRVCLQGITSGPHLERRAPLPPTLPEDLDPREAEPDGEQGLWELPASAQGGLCARHTGGSPRGQCWARSQDGSRAQTATWGPEPREGVLGWVPGLWLLWKALEWVLGLRCAWKGRQSVTFSPLAAAAAAQESQPIPGAAPVSREEPAAGSGARATTEAPPGTQESLPLGGVPDLSALSPPVAAAALGRRWASGGDPRRDLELSPHPAPPKKELPPGPALVPSGNLELSMWPLLVEEAPSPSPALVFARALELSFRPAFQQEVHSPTPALVPSRELEQSSHPEALKDDTSPAPALVSAEAQEQTWLPAFPVEESPPAPARVSSGEVELSLHTKPQKGEPLPAPLPAPAGDSELLLCPAAPKDERPAAPALVTAANLEFAACLPPLQGWPARDCPSGLLPLPQFQPCPPPECPLASLVFFTFVVYLIFILWPYLRDVCYWGFN